MKVFPWAGNWDAQRAVWRVCQWAVSLVFLKAASRAERKVDPTAAQRDNQWAEQMAQRLVEHWAEYWASQLVEWRASWLVALTAYRTAALKGGQWAERKDIRWVEQMVALRAAS